MRLRALLLLLLLSCSILVGAHSSPSYGYSLQTAPDIGWARPDKSTLHDTGPITTPAADRRSYDCTWLTYRMIDDLSKTMQRGCFVAMAFGLMDPDQNVIIFNGTDEGEYVKDGGQPVALSSVPFSNTVARFGGFPNLGSYMYLYTDFYGSLGNGSTVLGSRYKQLGGALPGYTVTGPSGQPLPVNPNAFAYSARGQWMVTETPSQALVRINLADFSVLPFAGSYFTPGQPFKNHGASMAVTEDGRYAAAASNEFSWFRVYDLKDCAAADKPGDPMAPRDCPKHDYWDYVRGQVAGELRSINHVSFLDDGLIGFEATTNLGTDSYLLAPSGSIDSLIPYLGLGDSYASGQGAFNYLEGTDTTVNQCHLSAKSYPLLLNQDIFGSRGHSVACSGAVIHDVGSTSHDYTGQNGDQRTARQHQADGSEVDELHDYSPGYLSQQRFVTAYQPGVMTVEIGGNDVGFGDIILSCLSPLASIRNANPNSCYQTYEDRLEIAQTVDRTYGRWVALYKQLQSQSPESTIYAVGYPQIVSPQADCRANVHLTPDEISFARDLVNYINSVIIKAAKAAGVRYVDISTALQGHELCSGASGGLAVNGITAGTDALGVLGQESFHPNAYGHQLIEQAILQNSHNLARAARPAADPGQAAPAVSDDDPVVKASKSGRAITTRIPTTTMTKKSAMRGSAIIIKTVGADTGHRANTVYHVSIGGIAVGTANSDANGNIQATVTVPTGSNSGEQPVVVSGPGQGGGTTTVVQIIYIHDSPTDYDGDGIPNDNDSCPLVINSGRDSDDDGIDDACDNVINLPVTGTGSSGSAPSSDSGTAMQPAVNQPPDTTSPQQPNPATHFITDAALYRLGAVSPILKTTISMVHPVDATVRLTRPAAHSVQTSRTLSVRGAVPPILATTLPPISAHQPRLPIFKWCWWLSLLLLVLVLRAGANTIRSYREGRL